LHRHTAGYIGWRNRFLGIEFWVPETFTNSGSGLQDSGSLATLMNQSLLSTRPGFALGDFLPAWSLFLFLSNRVRNSSEAAIERIEY
jgi:hypothetical protein